MLLYKNQMKNLRYIVFPSMALFVSSMLICILLLLSLRVIAPDKLPVVIQNQDFGSSIIVDVVIKKNNKLEVKAFDYIEEVNFTSLFDALFRVQSAANNNMVAVRIRTEKNVPYEDVIKVMDNSRRAGITKIELVEPKQAQVLSK